MPSGRPAIASRICASERSSSRSSAARMVAAPCSSQSCGATDPRPPASPPLGQKIALALGGTAQVGQQEVTLLRVDAVGGAQAQRRDAHALLPGLGGGGEIAARPGAADVAPMGQADGEGEQSAFEEDRPDGLHVGQMVAADLGQVEEPDVARPQPLGRARASRNFFTVKLMTPRWMGMSRPWAIRSPL